MMANVLGLKSFVILLFSLIIFQYPLFSFDDLDPSDEDWLMEQDTLVFAVDKQNPPMNFLNDKGKMEGITIDYIQLIAAKMGVAVEFYPAPWNEALQKALDHEVDGILNASIKEDRKAYLNFSKSYFNSPDAILTLRDTELFQGPQSFEGQTVAVIRNSARKDVFLNYSPGSVILEVETLEDGVSAVLEGRAIGFLDESNVIQNLLDHYFISNLKVNSVIFFPELGSTHIGLRNDDPRLLRLINRAIEEISAEEKSAILDAYQKQMDSVPRLANPGFTGEEKKWLTEHRVILVGADSAWAPMQFSEKGVAKGISQDYLERLAPIMGVEFRVIQDEWFKIINLAKTRQVDILSCAQDTLDRRDFLNFTEPYLQIPVVLLSRSNLTFLNYEKEIHNYRIGLLKGYASEELFRRTYPDLSYDLFPNMDEAVSALMNNEIDILVENQQAIIYYIAQKRIYGLHIVGELPFSYDLSIGVRKDWPILQSILNKSLAMISEEEKQEILQGWNYITLRQEVDFKKIFLLSSFFTLLLSLLLIWNLIVSRKARIRSAQLQESRRMEAIGNIAGGIAHDFKNILMGVSGFTELLQQGTESEEEKQQYLNEILHAVDNGTELSDQILMYSKGSELNFREVNMSDICEQMIRLLQNSSSQSINVDSKIEPECIMQADPTQMKQLILNLGNNAIKAMEKSPRKKLTIRLEQYKTGSNSSNNKQKLNGDYTLLMIADTGCGISEKNIGKIFDPYFTTRSREKGTGLGLATVDRIVKNHKGVIELKTLQDRGTTITIYFPD